MTGRRQPEKILRFESDEDVEWAARVMEGSEPWITLGRGYEASRADLSDDAKERYVALADNDRAGFLILNMAGAFVSYIQTVWALPSSAAAESRSA